ncbi:MAG TPA: fumarylacetoacetate hydrolase family protein [Candidatus Eisenbacteria bacterium]|jgi:fumarylacetoacetate (FAA) hydrolase
MRLVSFTRKGASETALGAPSDGGVVDLAVAASILTPTLDSAGRLRSMEALLAEWEPGLAAARTVLERVQAAPAGGRRALVGAGGLLFEGAIETKPPVARPPAIRDFYAFEAHVRNARARRGLPVPPEWYEFPVFYFSNPGALVGHGEGVRKPAWTEALDFELELACVIGRRARDVAPDDWRSVVAGFTILNDWSARDIQRREMSVGLGPAKGKDFATSLGPALVTLDELEARRRGDRYDLAMEARVNGATLSRGNAGDMHYGWGALIARASQDVYLLPGDVLGSGTMGGGCLLELGTEVHRWLQPGDEVTLQVELLGVLSNMIL